MGKKRNKRKSLTTVPDASSKQVSELLKSGHAAVDEFDLEAARSFFSEAVEKSGGALEPSLELLELLVNTLADDGAALSLSLPSASAAHPRIRLLLAQAAARKGEPETAVEWLKGLEGAETQSVWLALARSALREERLEPAREFIQQARAVGAMTTEILRFEKRFSQVAERLLQERFVALDRAIESKELENAETRARQLLELWPEGEQARAALKRITREKRLQKAAESTLAAEEAFEAGDFSRAQALYLEARELGAERGALEARMAACARAAEEQARRTLREEVLRHHSAGDFPAALRSYAGLNPEARSQLRHQLNWPALEWLDQFHTSAAGPTEDEVAAVAALANASRSEARANPERLLKALEAHRGILTSLEAGEELLRWAQDGLGHFRSQRALRQLEQAEAALEQGDYSGVDQALSILDENELPTAASDRLEHVKAQVMQVRDRALIREELAQAERSGRLDLALDAASSLLPLVSGGEKKEINEARIRLIREIRHQWRVTVLEGEDARQVGGSDLSLQPASANLRLLRMPDGRILSLTSRANWVFVRQMESESGLITRAIALRTSKTLEHFKLEMEGDRLRAIGHGPTLLELSISSGDVLRFHSASSHLPPVSADWAHDPRPLSDRADSSERWRNTNFPSLQGPFACQVGVFVRDLTTEKLNREYRELPAEERGDWVDRQKQEAAGIPKRLLSLAAALNAAGDDARARELLELVRDLHEKVPDLAFEEMMYAAETGRWSEASRLGRTIDPSQLRFYRPIHHYHLTGLALFHKGNLEGAQERWREGLQLQRAIAGGEATECNLEGYVAMLEAGGDSTRCTRAGGEDTWDPKWHRVSCLRAALRAANERIERRDFEGALWLLDHQAIWGSLELQLLGRMAECHLRLKASSPGQEMRMLLTLATFVDLFRRFENDPSSVNELPLPSERWRPRRMADIARRAEARLGEAATSARA